MARVKPKNQPGHPYSFLVDQFVARRLELGISQFELEEIIGLSEGHITKYENRVRHPDAYFLHFWAQGLGLDLVATPQVSA